MKYLFPITLRSGRWFLIALISVIFAGGLFYNYDISKSNSRDLTEVQEKAFPIFEKIQRLKVKFLSAQERLAMAVLTQSELKVREVERDEQEILDILSELRLQADYLPALGPIRPAFEEYLHLGEVISRHLIWNDNDLYSIQKQIFIFREKGNLLSDILDKLSRESQENYTIVLKRSRENSELMLRVGLWSSIAGVLLLGGISTIIINLNRQLVYLNNQLVAANESLEYANQNLEKEVKARTQEIESFVYTVSHDLKAPIVSMQGMASLLLEDWGSQADEKIKRYIGRIIHNANYMEELITGLLALSRIGRKQQNIVRAEVKEVLGEILDLHQQLFLSKKIQVLIQPSLPSFTFEKMQSTQLFQNLITNSAKFMGDQPFPKIEIGGRALPESIEFYVKDNGIGIDPAYHDKVFGLFQRLKEVEVEGTGVGLSIVKKIVDLAGGRIWIESKKGEGTTFFIQFPRKETGPAS
jgi:signal transduction histidine kinase